mgnify:CR=1 FL=1
MTYAPVDVTDRVGGELLELLHQGASAHEFARRLADVEALPDTHPAKSVSLERARMAMALRDRLELQQERERGLWSVIESAQDLAGRLDLQGLLNAIVIRARALLGSDVAWLSAFDPVGGEFRVLAADGAMSQGTHAMVARRDCGVAGIVMSTWRPFTTTDYLQDGRFVHDTHLDDTFRQEGPGALVGLPLIRDNEIVGLLFVADRYRRPYTTQAISILSTLATHGAVALRNARDFERAAAALAEASQARDQLERHLRGIQSATDAHERLTSLLARGASLATLCQAIADMLAGDLLVLDELGHVVGKGLAAAHDSAGARGYTPRGEHGAALAEATRRSRETGRSVLAYEADGEHCRVMCVIGGDDTLGTALMFHHGDLKDIALRTFERSASVIGIVLLSQQRAEAARNRSASTLLRSLVSLRQDELGALATAAARHGLDLSHPLALVLVEIEGGGAAAAARRFRSETALRDALVDDVDGTLVVLCTATAATDARRTVSAWLGREVAAAHRGVLSRPLTTPAQLPASYATLRRALAVLSRLGASRVILDQNELALYSALFESHDQASLRAFVDATIGATLAHDRKRGSGLTATLLCYFDSNQNARTTAQRLGIHVNTVRQRLAAGEDLLGHWGNASRALEIHMALRVWDLGEHT